MKATRTPVDEEGMGNAWGHPGLPDDLPALVDGRRSAVAATQCVQIDEPVLRPGGPAAASMPTTASILRIMVICILASIWRLFYRAAGREVEEKEAMARSAAPLRSAEFRPRVGPGRVSLSRPPLASIRGLSRLDATDGA